MFDKINMFHKGDRVISLVDHPNYNKFILSGSVGTVCGLDMTLIHVHWDEFVDGHNCEGGCPYGHGWNVYPKNIDLLNEKQFEFDEQAFREMIGV